MKATARMVLIGCILARWVMAADSPDRDILTARTNIIRALPAGWQPVFNSDDYQKRLTQLYFANPRTDAFILTGRQVIASDITDREGKTYQEPLWKEALCVWIVPADFQPPFPKKTLWDLIDSQWHPDPVFASEMVKVYAIEHCYVVDTNRFHELLKKAARTTGHEVRLTWKSWGQDIAASLKE
jgi:hypothetical protein